MDMARNVMRKLISAAVIVAALTGTASAQLPMGLSLGASNKHKLTPEEQAKQDEIDQAYKSATNKIPDRNVNDPWADVRPAPAPSVKKKQTMK
jgi:hypothetical protein